MSQPLTTRVTTTSVALLLGLLGALAALGAVGLAAGPAAAAGEDCVTRSEFREVAQGDTRRAVHRTFGTAGTFGDGGAGGFSRTYTQCRGATPDGETCRVVVEYAAGPGERARVEAKRFNGVCE